MAGIVDASVVKKAFQPMLSSSTIFMGDERYNCQPQSSTGSKDHTEVASLQSSSFQVIWLYTFHTKKCSVVQLEKVWRSTTNVSIRYDNNNNVKICVLVVIKLLSSTIKIAYADDKLPFF